MLLREVLRVAETCSSKKREGWGLVPRLHRGHSGVSQGKGVSKEAADEPYHSLETLPKNTSLVDLASDGSAPGSAASTSCTFLSRCSSSTSSSQDSCYGDRAEGRTATAGSTAPPSGESRLLKRRRQMQLEKQRRVTPLIRVRTQDLPKDVNDTVAVHDNGDADKFQGEISLVAWQHAITCIQAAGLALCSTWAFFKAIGLLEAAMVSSLNTVSVTGATAAFGLFGACRSTYSGGALCLR